MFLGMVENVGNVVNRQTVLVDLINVPAGVVIPDYELPCRYQ
jgi:hypothetical protein